MQKVVIFLGGGGGGGGVDETIYWGTGDRGKTAVWYPLGK